MRLVVFASQLRHTATQSGLTKRRSYMDFSMKPARMAAALGFGGLLSIALTGSVVAQQEVQPGLSLYGSKFIVANLIDFKIQGDTKVAALLTLDKLLGDAAGYPSADLAKAAAAKVKGVDVIIRNGAGSAARYTPYSVKAFKTTPANIDMLKTGKYSELAHDPSIALDYATLKCGVSLELYRPDAEIQKGIFAENIVSDAGLYVTGYEFQKGYSNEISIIELTVFRELLKNNLDEVKAAYACFDARVKAKDPKATPKMRQSFLSSMWANYQRGPQLHPFVEKEMKKYKYTKEQRAAVTG